ncbi:jg15264, partial [Pararge aegeria aegeria]
LPGYRFKKSIVSAQPLLTVSCQLLRENASVDEFTLARRIPFVADQKTDADRERREREGVNNICTRERPRV